MYNLPSFLRNLVDNKGTKEINKRRQFDRIIELKLNKEQHLEMLVGARFSEQFFDKLLLGNYYGLCL